MSNEIKGVGNSYTAEFWEYDPRLGRRWNIDPVNMGDISPYQAFANNPIIFVDPYGLDTVNSSRSAQVGDVFQHRNKNSNFYWNKTEDGWEGGGSSENLAGVTVTAKKKGGGSNFLNYPSSTKADRRQWDIDQRNYRLGDFSRLTQQQIAKYRSWDKADQEWRQNSLFSLGAMAAPLVGIGLVETGAASFGINFLARPFLAATGRYGATLKVAAWMQFGNAGADLTYQTIKWSMTGDGVNLGSTFGNLYFKNPLLSSLPGAIVKPEGNLLSTWGRGALGDAIGNIPIPGVKIGSRLGMEGFTMPLIGNLSSDVFTGQFK